VKHGLAERNGITPEQRNRERERGQTILLVVDNAAMPTKTAMLTSKRHLYLLRVLRCRSS
jgi:hypothetical protein